MKEVRIHIAQQDCTSNSSASYDLCVSFDKDEAIESIYSAIRYSSKYDVEHTDMWLVMTYDIEVPDDLQSAKDCYKYALDEDTLGECSDAWYPYWYAVCKHNDGSDLWDEGSFILDEAKDILREYRESGYEHAVIAVIDNHDLYHPYCVDEIRDIDD